VEEPQGGVLIIHGAGSQKENHFGIAREMAGAGLSAICFDQRGHGESEGPMDARIVSDAVAMTQLFNGLPVGIRGSSMGGWVALASADESGAKALVPICPTTAEQLTLGATSGRFPFEADLPSLVGKLSEGDPAAPSVPTLLLHAAGDEVVSVDRSRTLAPLLTHSESRYIEFPGGHHRSLQHDAEVTELSVRFLATHLAGA
jgi:alpha-beta hydrolase superfamily lysophospholipase